MSSKNSESDGIATYIAKVGGKYPEGAVVFNAKTQTFYPMGGGPVYRAGPDFLERFRVVTAEEMKPTWQPAMFELAGVGRFRGYTCGQVWNGWACPVFDYKTARSVLEKMGAADHDCGTMKFTWGFNLTEDAFYHHSLDDGMTESAECREVGQFIQVNEGTLLVYPIGAQQWCWEIVDPDCPGDFCVKCGEVMLSASPVDEDDGSWQGLIQIRQSDGRFACGYLTESEMLELSEQLLELARQIRCKRGEQGP
jgi:hypothetical protein